jgi:hypothetical protein
LGWNDYGARNYDALLGRWMGVDALAEKYMAYNPYVYCLGNPISLIDPDGRYVLPAALAQQYSKLDNYLRNGIGNLLNQKDIRSGLKIIGNFNDDQINQLARYGEGIPINILQLDIDAMHSTNGEANGYTPGNGSIQIDATLAQQLQDANTPETEAVALFAVVSTILHETTHQGFNANPIPYNRTSRNKSDGDFSRTYDPKMDQYIYRFKNVEVGNSEETGNAFDKVLWYDSGKNTNFGFYKKQGPVGLENQADLYKFNSSIENPNLPKKSNE